MKPNPEFLNLPKSFWAYVRAISQQVGYTDPAKKVVRVPDLDDLVRAMKDKGLASDHLAEQDGRATLLGKQLLDYFKHRARALNRYVEPKLMNADRAAREFGRLRKELRPACPIPMNKQTGKKKRPAYLTAIVNMIVEAHSKGLPCDYDPRTLTMVTRDGAPLRTLSRRVDGAFPAAVDPIAVWEIKEYYHTTTFGSRVADGVYETLLDGLELAEMREHEGIHVLHYLMVDAHYTWWECGRSYLCRIVDALHMGYVDEVLFGYEVVERLPSLVRKWSALARKRT